MAPSRAPSRASPFNCSKVGLSQQKKKRHQQQCSVLVRCQNKASGSSRSARKDEREIILGFAHFFEIGFCVGWWFLSPIFEVGMRVASRQASFPQISNTTPQNHSHCRAIPLIMSKTSMVSSEGVCAEEFHENPLKSVNLCLQTLFYVSLQRNVAPRMRVMWYIWPTSCMSAFVHAS
jgi:hypothetical protein